MSLMGVRASRANEPPQHDATAPFTKMRNVTISAVTEAHADEAGGGALDLTSGWTDLDANVASRVLLITLGAGSNTDYTVTAVDDEGVTHVETVSVDASDSNTTLRGYKSITSVTTAGDPGATTEFDWGDTLVSPPARGIHVGTAGDIACIAAEDSTAVTVPDVAAGVWPVRLKRVNITNTTASGLVLGW